MNAQVQQNLIDLAGIKTVGFENAEIRHSGRQVGIYGKANSEYAAGYEIKALCIHLRNMGFRVNEIRPGASWSVHAER